MQVAASASLRLFSPVAFGPLRAARPRQEEEPVRSRLRPPIILAVAILAASAARGQRVEISVTTTSAVPLAELDWQSIPGQTYRVHTAPDLVAGSWMDTTPGGLLTSNVIGHYEHPATNRTGFFRLSKDDTDSPVVTNLSPAADAIAVASNAPVVISLFDETGIDSNSIALQIAAWSNLTVASPSVMYSNGTVTFTPPTELGSAGAHVTNSLTVADSLGHTLTNYTWSFQLERPDVGSSSFLPLTAPPEGGMAVMDDGRTMSRSIVGVQPLDGTDEFHIVSVTSNTVVFSYSGAPPAISNGSILVSSGLSPPPMAVDSGRFYRPGEK